MKSKTLQFLCIKSCIFLFCNIFLSYSYLNSQEIQLKTGTGVQLFGTSPIIPSWNNGHLKSNKYLMPNFNYSIRGSFRYPIWKKYKLFAAGGIDQSVTRFYYAIRAENDKSSYHFENVFFNFHATTFNLGLHKSIDLFDQNVRLNFGLNYDVKVNYSLEKYKGSRDYPKELYNSYSLSNPIFYSNRLYEYRVYLYQDYRIDQNFSLQLDLRFKLKGNIGLICAAIVPLGANWYIGSSVDYEVRSSETTNLTPIPPAPPASSIKWYYNFDYTTHTRPYHFTTFYVGLSWDLKGKSLFYGK